MVPGGDFHAFFFVYNVKTWDQTEVRNEENKYANYWLAPTGSQGEFILDLENEILVNSVEIVNTHHAGMRTRSSREFKVWLSLELYGPWQVLGSYILPDSRNDPDPGILHKYEVEVKPPLARFVKFRLISYYGDIGGGLQYFAVKGSQINTTTINTTTTPASTITPTLTTTPPTFTTTVTPSINITSQTTEATTTQTKPAIASSTNESPSGNPVGTEGKF